MALIEASTQPSRDVVGSEDMTGHEVEDPSRVVPDTVRPTTRSEMRPEIQALRALAVLTVVLYHVWPAAMPGGFIGVDVFFAISGFLITAHLLREVEATGRLSLWGFWARRARRLLPAALLTLLVCALGTILLVPQVYWQQFLAEIGTSTAYVQNWQLAADAVDYLGADNRASPVQRGHLRLPALYGYLGHRHGAAGFGGWESPSRFRRIVGDDRVLLYAPARQ